MFHKRMCWFAVVLTALALAGCGLGGGGSVSVTILPEKDIAPRLLLPALGMTCAEYDVSIAGPSPQGPVTVTDGATFTDLKPGTYTVSVDGYNGDNPRVKIGTGSSSVVVAVGGTAETTVTVLELTGNGSHSWSVTWEPPCVAAPRLDITRVDFAGTETVLDSAEDAGTGSATGSEADVPKGFYALVGKLYDAGTTDVLAAGFADIIRIVAGVNTPWTTHLYANQAFGGLDIGIVDGIEQPIVVTVPGYTNGGTVGVYEGGTKTVTVGDPGFGHVTTWYLNGQAVAIDDSYTVSAALCGEPGSKNRLDAIMWSADGNRAGSFMLYVDVKANPCANDTQLAIVFTVNADHAGQTWNYEVDHNGGTRESQGDGVMVAGENVLVISGLPQGFSNYRVCLNVVSWHYMTGLSVPTPGGCVADFGLLH